MTHQFNGKSKSKWIGLFSCICLLVSCFQNGGFSQESKRVFNFNGFIVEIQKGTYAESYLDETIRVVTKQKNVSNMILDETYDGRTASMFEFKQVQFKDYMILYNTNKVFYFFVFDRNGNTISSFPIKRFIVQDFKIDNETGFIRVVGGVTKEEAVKTVVSLTMGKSWSIK